MAIRYKFRSSVNFDSVDIEGRPSISIRDLKSKIVQSKKLNVCQDFDLVFSDALTGQEYVDENFQISSGSSVIIKRVPAGSVPSNAVYNGSFPNFGIKDVSEVKTPCLVKNLEIDFDDFGIDLCPVPEWTLSCSDIDAGMETCVGNEKKNVDDTRWPEPPILGYKKLDASDFTEAIPRGPVHSGIEENILEKKSKPCVEQHMKKEKAVVANVPAMQSTIFPSELKCSLCNTLFKEAVMIPCCQHSFCKQCIQLVLVEKARCPKCLCSKYRVQDLLPNLSLRQAIEHFLESQLLISGTENALHDYAPDGESGIQAKEVSCAVTNLQRQVELPDSPSATERGSNQFVAESACDSLLRKNTTVVGTGSCVNHLGGGKSLKSCLSRHNTKQIDGERDGSSHLMDIKSRPVNLDDFAECQGENQPIHEEADPSTKKKRAFSVNTACADKSFMESGRLKKGNRSCYMCGSPDHFIRDCPAASGPNPMLQTGNASFPRAMHGYISPYWNGPPVPHVRPFANIYGNPVMMPFNPTMVPAPPFAFPRYMPSMFGGPPAYDGFMRMGGMTTPIGISTERQLCHPGISDRQEYEMKYKFSNENTRSGQSSADDDHFNQRCRFDQAERLHDPKSHVGRERSVTHSEDSFTHRSRKRHLHDSKLDDDKYYADEKHEKNSRSSISGRERRPHHSDRLSSEVENMPSSSSWHCDERHKNHNRNSKKHNERREQCGSDYSCGRHPCNKEKDVERKRPKSDVSRHKQKHKSCSGSGLEPNYSSDKKKQLKEGDFSDVSRHSRHNSRSVDDELSHDRWMMIRGSDENVGEDYHYNKRKRVY